MDELHPHYVHCPKCNHTHKVGRIAELERKVKQEQERTYKMIQECNATQAELERQQVATGYGFLQAKVERLNEIADLAAALVKHKENYDYANDTQMWSLHDSSLKHIMVVIDSIAALEGES